MANLIKKEELNYSLKYDLYSFDVFDTLVTRKTATPQGIFVLVQEKIKKIDIPKILKENFFTIRIGAEQQARVRQKRLNGSQEITFDEIYDIIQINYNLSVEQRNALKKIELDTEKENLISLPIVNHLEQLIKKDKKVILISDMYLSSAQIRYLIEDKSFAFKNISIYVSSEYRESKARGGLYNKVQQIENIKPSKWLHSGDNRNSDIKVAKKYKIATKYIPAIGLKKYQKIFIDKSCNSAYSQIIIGTSRLLDLKKPNTHYDKYIFGASYVAPIMYEYVNWILNCAIERGFETLYFVARDGFIPKEVADIIIKKRNLNIKTKYIYGSRKVWYLPSEENYELWVNHVFSRYIDCFSLSTLSFLSNLPTDFLKEITSIKDENYFLKNNERLKLIEQCLKNEQIKSRIKNLLAPCVKNAKKYIEQEVDLLKNDIAFVDINGSGYSMDFLSAICNENSDRVFTTFYLKNSFMQQLPKSKKLCFCVNNRYDLLLELISKTNQGATLAYEYNSENRLVAKIDCIDKTIWDNWGYSEYLLGIKDFVSCIAENQFMDTIRNSPLDLYNAFAEFYHKNLDFETAEILGTIPFSYVGLEKNLKECAPKYHVKSELLNFFVRTSESVFQNISKVRSSKRAVKTREKIIKIKNYLKINSK